MVGWREAKRSANLSEMPWQQNRHAITCHGSPIDQPAGAPAGFRGKSLEILTLIEKSHSSQLESEGDGLYQRIVGWKAVKIRLESGWMTFDGKFQPTENQSSDRQSAGIRAEMRAGWNTKEEVQLARISWNRMKSADFLPESQPAGIRRNRLER